MKCIICENTIFEELFQGRDLLHGVEGTFHLLRCKQCSLATLSPILQPDELDKYYPPGYISFPKAVADEHNILRRLDRWYGIEKRCQQVIRRAKRPGKLLDIGCATGVFLHGMQQHGWDCYGVEPSVHASAYARDRFNLPVFTGFLEESNFQNQTFDVITMWDVLEHVPNPKQVLEMIHTLLNPGGWLVISMPNSQAWERYIFGKYWAGWDVPRHFYVYDPKTVSQLLLQQCFDVKEIVSFTGRHGVLVLNMQFWMQDWHSPEWVKNGILEISRSIFARLITYPFYAVADTLNRSSIMTIFAQKKSL
jgi:SAM-dependent methyltransferase